MAYIGIQPAEKFTSFATQEFSTSATTSYTLDHAVANENEIALFVNNVRQQPGSGKAYTATGTALTLSAATASTDTMYCVFLGRALQTVTPATNSITGDMLGTNFVYNESGASTDFRIESDSNTHQFFVDGSADKVGINSSAPLAPLHVASATSDADGSLGSQSPQMILQGGTGNQNNRFEFGMDSSGGTAIGFLQSRNTSSGVQDISLNPVGGNTMVGKASTSDTTTGAQFTTNGALNNILNASGYNLINRQADDGVLIYFKQANSTEGNISVSGTTVSYNGFTGTHWTRLADNSKPTILKGTVLETLDEMVDWYNLEFDDSDGNAQKIPHLLTDSQSAGDKITYDHNGTDYEATIVKETDIKHMKSKVSDTTDAKNVYGVFSHWDFGDDDGINDIIVASVGSFVVRIKSGETIAKGDLLQSNGDGTAKVQSDDNIKSNSFAKVLSTTKIETYSDGSYIVPCSLMC